MIIFTILAIALLAALVVAAIALLLGGTGFIIVFGDLLVFGLIVWLLIRVFKRRK